MRYFLPYHDCIARSPRSMDITCNGKKFTAPYAGSKYITPTTTPTGIKIVYLTMDEIDHKKGKYSFKLMKHHSDDSVLVASVVLSDAEYDEIMTDKVAPVERLYSAYDIYLDTIGRYLHVDWMCPELVKAAQEKANGTWDNVIEWSTSSATIRCNPDWGF